MKDCSLRLFNGILVLSLTVLFLLSILNTRVHAEVFELSVEESIQYLLENNRDFQKYEADYRRARIEVIEAASAALPSARLDGNFTYLGNVQSFEFDTDFDGPEPPMKLKTASEEMYSGTFAVEQSLFSGSIFGAIRVASSYKKAAMYAFESQKHSLVKDYLVAYAQLRMLKDIVDLNAEMVELTKSHFDEAKLLHEIGAADNYSLMRAEVEYLNSIPLHKNAIKDLEAAESGLKLMLNLERDEQLVTHDFDIEILPGDNPDILLAKASDDRPEISSADHLSKAYKRAVGVYRAGRWPTVDAFYNFERQNQWDLFTQTDRWDNTWVAGINLSFPLFTGFRTSAQIQKAKLDLAKARHDASMLNDMIQLEVKLAYNDYLRSSSDFEAWYRNVELAEEGLEIAKLRWSTGNGSDLELRDARIALKAARVNLSSAKFDLVRSKVQLLFATGDLDQINIIELSNDGQ